MKSARSAKAYRVANISSKVPYAITSTAGIANPFMELRRNANKRYRKLLRRKLNGIKDLKGMAFQGIYVQVVHCPCMVSLMSGPVWVCLMVLYV
jgi:hypothetical protein